MESVSAARVWVRDEVRVVNSGAGGQGAGAGLGGAILLTDDTEGFSGKAEAALPSSVAAATSSRPDTDDVLQSKHHNHHEFLWGQGPEFSPISRTGAQVTQPRNIPESLGTGISSDHLPRRFLPG